MLQGKKMRRVTRKMQARKNHEITKRCYSCELKDYVSSNCPTKEKDIKYFACNEYGHVASDCLKKNATKSSCAIAQPH